MAELGVDVFGAGDGLGDFIAQQGAEAVAEAVERHPERRLGEAEPGGKFRVWQIGGAAAGEGGEEEVERLGAAGGSLFGAQPVGNRPEEREGPGTVEGVVGGGFGRVGERGVVERRLKSYVATRGVGVVAEVGEVVVEGGEEPGAKTDGAGLERGERFEAEEAGEKSLDGVLGVGGREPAPERVAEERRAVGRAELGQGAAGNGRRIRFPMTSGVEHKRPAGGVEGGGQK